MAQSEVDQGQSPVLGVVYDVGGGEIAVDDVGVVHSRQDLPGVFGEVPQRLAVPRQVQSGDVVLQEHSGRDVLHVDHPPFQVQVEDGRGSDPMAPAERGRGGVGTRDESMFKSSDRELNSTHSCNISFVMAKRYVASCHSPKRRPGYALISCTWYSPSLEPRPSTQFFSQPFFQNGCEKNCVEGLGSRLV